MDELAAWEEIVRELKHIHTQRKLIRYAWQEIGEERRLIRSEWEELLSPQADRAPAPSRSITVH